MPFNYEGSAFLLLTVSQDIGQKQAMTFCKGVGSDWDLFQLPPSADYLRGLSQYMMTVPGIGGTVEAWEDRRTTESIGDIIVPGVNGKRFSH